MIGTTAAILGSALISSAASVGGSMLTAHQAGQTANANNQLAREQYGENKANLDPFMSAGREALGQIGNFGDNVDWQAYLNANPDVLAAYKANEATYQAQGESPEAFAQRHYAEHGKAEGRALPSTGTNQNLADFQSAEGLTPLNNQFADTVGSSYGDYLDRSGVGPDITRSEALTGGSVDQYRANVGTDKTNAATQTALGLDGGGYDAYLDDTKHFNDAIDAFLGIQPGGGGLADFLKGTGYDFTLKTALDSATQGKATAGLLGSGSTLKALQDRGAQVAHTFGQQYLTDLGTAADQRSQQKAGYVNALSGFGNTLEGQGLNYGNLIKSNAGLKSATYGDYTQGVLNRIANQRGQAGDYLDFTSANANRGLTAANALAGVGTNMVGQVTQNNNNALQARAGGTAAAVNGVNGAVGNALATYGYLQGQQAPRPPTSSSWYAGPGYTPFVGA